MRKLQIMNILLCFDDVKGDYTRHAAVTILSLLETNKMNKIKIWILSSIIPQENVNELKRIVNSYNQEIEFIIVDNIVPTELKNVIININNLTRGTRYRWFLSKYIKGIDRILYIDCDVLIMKDISDIYNMNMHGKTLAGYYVPLPYRCKNTYYGIKYYFNAGVLLFNAKKYTHKIITVKKIGEINKEYSYYYRGGDEEKMNIICKDDIFIHNKGMNYQITNKFINDGIDDAEIIHCLEKPYKQYSGIPKKYVKLYYKYLDMTKWKGYPEKRANYGYIHHIYNTTYHFCFNLLIKLLGEKLMMRIISRKRKIYFPKGYRNPNFK